MDPLTIGRAFRFSSLGLPGSILVAVFADPVQDNFLNMIVEAAGIQSIVDQWGDQVNSIFAGISDSESFGYFILGALFAILIYYVLNRVSRLFPSSQLEASFARQGAEIVESHRSKLKG